jgi:hypothetical protein
MTPKLWLYVGVLLFLSVITGGIYYLGYSHAEGKVTAVYEKLESERVIKELATTTSLEEFQRGVELERLVKAEALAKKHKSELNALRLIIKESGDACIHSDIPNDLLNGL